MRTWEDALREAAAEFRRRSRRCSPSPRAFPRAIAARFTAAEALLDARRIAAIGPTTPIAIDYYRHADQPPEQAALKIYHHGAPVALSRRVPVLENIGFHVISERTFEVRRRTRRAGLHPRHGTRERVRASRSILRTAARCSRRSSCRSGAARPTTTATTRLPRRPASASRAIGVLRAYGRYLQQAGIPQSQDFIAAVLNRYPDIARGLHDLFVARLDPASGTQGTRHGQAPDAPRSRTRWRMCRNIDDDTIIRRYLNLIEASLRTNHFVPGLRGRASRSPSSSIRARVDGLPDPRPWREIFVYGPEVEGVHLRFGPVARGGLRWSDRAQDYRTEVLGLVKAQQVKNAVIVPVGAKGGFFPKRLPTAGSSRRPDLRGRPQRLHQLRLQPAVDHRQHRRRRRRAARRRRAPRQDDPYFVVAADKGTATFSDTANAHQPDSTISGSTTPSPPAVRPATTTRRWASPPGRLGSGEAAFPRDEPRHPDDALHRRRRRRHVGRRVRQRHAAVGRRPG